MNDQISLLVRKAKLKFFTNALIFFGMCANKFSWEIEPLPESIEGYVKFIETDLSRIESGSIHINESFVSKPDYTYNNLIFIICHELLHILNKHGTRRGDREWETWNVAADHVIEVFLRNMSDIIKPYHNRYNIISEIYNDKPDCTVEYAYDWLIKHPRTIQIGEQEDMTIEVSDKNGNVMFTVTANLGGITSATEDIDSLKVALTDQLVAEARAIFENLKSKGNSPGYLVSYLDKILKVEIPWETLVEKSIKTNVIMKPDERSWRCLNKYFVPHKINIPGYASVEDTEGTGTLIIGVDSSGSISDKDLKKFSSVVEHSMQHFKIVKLLVHDTDVRQRYEFTKENIGEFYKFVSKTGYHGRGGTSHKYLFEEIQKEFWEKDKDELSMVLSLTDNYSDIEYNYKQFEWIKNNLPLVIIISKGGKLLSLDGSFGNITQIKIN